MTMKTMRTILMTLGLLVLAAWPAQAQRLLTTTTLNANLAATDATMTVSSSTGFTVGQLALIDAEVVRITNLNGVAGTSTLISITRGVDGTQQRAHDNAERMIVTLQNNDFHNTDPDYGADCVRGAGQAAISPWANTRTGVIFMCGESSAGGTAWTATSTIPLTYGSIPTSF